MPIVFQTSRSRKLHALLKGSSISCAGPARVKYHPCPGQQFSIAITRVLLQPSGLATTAARHGKPPSTCASAPPCNKQRKTAPFSAGLQGTQSQSLSLLLGQTLCAATNSFQVSLSTCMSYAICDDAFGILKSAIHHTYDEVLCCTHSHPRVLHRPPVALGGATCRPCRL